MKARFAVGDRVLWRAMWLHGKRIGTVTAVHGPRAYILHLDKPLPAPHSGQQAVAFANELEALDESIAFLGWVDPAFERFMRKVLEPEPAAPEKQKPD